MLDINMLRNDPEKVRENIRKKFKEQKLPLVDEVIALDAANRAAITEASELRAKRNALSKANGPLFGKLKKAGEEEKAAMGLAGRKKVEKEFDRQIVVRAYLDELNEIFD